MHPINVVAPPVRTALVHPPQPSAPTERPGSFPSDVRNEALSATKSMPGMPVYGSRAASVPLDLLSVAAQLQIASDQARHGEKLNDPHCLFIVDDAHAAAHAEYRLLCQELQQPGRYCIRRVDGFYLLVHRPRGTGAQLKRTVLEFSAAGWKLLVPHNARLAWRGLRDHYFPTLDALKAALPRGMTEATDVSLEETRL